MTKPHKRQLRSQNSTCGAPRWPRCGALPRLLQGPASWAVACRAPLHPGLDGRAGRGSRGVSARAGGRKPPAPPFHSAGPGVRRERAPAARPVGCQADVAQDEPLWVPVSSSLKQRGMQLAGAGGDTWGSMSRENLTPHGSEMRAEAARPQGPAGDADPGHHPRPRRAGQSPLLGHPRARPGACLGLSQKLPGSGQHGASGCQGRASQLREEPGPAAGGRPPAPGGKPPAPQHQRSEWPEAGHQLPGAGALAAGRPGPGALHSQVGSACHGGSRPPRPAHCVTWGVGHPAQPPRPPAVLRLRTGPGGRRVTWSSE